MLREQRSPLPNSFFRGKKKEKYPREAINHRPHWILKEIREAECHPLGLQIASGAFDGTRYLKSTHGTFRKRTRRQYLLLGKFSKQCPKDLGVRAHVTKTIREYVRVCERERGSQPLVTAGGRPLSKRMVEYLFTPTAVTPRSCQSFIAIRTIPNSNTNGFTPLSSRINRDFHRVRLNEGKLDKSSASCWNSRLSPGFQIGNWYKPLVISHRYSTFWGFKLTMALCVNCQKLVLYISFFLIFLNWFLHMLLIFFEIHIKKSRIFRKN